MRKLGLILGFGSSVPVNIRVINIVLSATLAVLTITSWAGLFFALCAWVAWSDGPKREGHDAG